MRLQAHKLASSQCAAARRPIRRVALRATADPQAAAVKAPSVISKPRLLYDGVIFDMDGTLTEAHIDFKDMRARTGIPQGDLFVAMESWEEEAAIKAAMDVILGIEAEAAQRVAPKSGLQQLMDFLEQRQVRVALVTRNTSASVEAFFKLVGDSRRRLFTTVRTREYPFVKPDKRLLLDLAQEWGADPARLLMVGDSTEDVEVGNAAGTATCLVAGGGNEVPGCNVAPPPGAVPTMCVEGLEQLQGILEQTAPGGLLEETAVAAGEALDLLGWPLRLSGASSSSSSGGVVLDPSSPGAPAPGLDFVDDCVRLGALRTASVSFPRMGAAAGGLAACPLGGGDQVIHVGCGEGSLTKMLASKGLQVVGVDANVAEAVARGLKCVEFEGGVLAGGSLVPSAMALGGCADVVMVYTAPGAAAGKLSSREVLQLGALQELRAVLGPGGYACIEVPAAGEQEGQEVKDAACKLLQQARFDPRVCQVQEGRLRIVAMAR